MMILIDRNVANADEPINAELMLGEWKVVSIYDPDTELTVNNDNNLKNNIIFSQKRVTQVTQISSTRKPYKDEYKYEIKGKCVLVLLSDENACWEVKELSKNQLILDTPAGIFHLRK